MTHSNTGYPAGLVPRGRQLSPSQIERLRTLFSEATGGGDIDALPGRELHETGTQMLVRSFGHLVAALDLEAVLVGPAGGTK